MDLPSYPEPGKPVSAEWARRLLDALRSTALFADGVSRLPGGTIADALRPAAPPLSSEPLMGDANNFDSVYKSIMRQGGQGVFGLLDFETAPEPETEDVSKLRVLVREEYQAAAGPGGDPPAGTAYRLVYHPVNNWSEY